MEERFFCAKERIENMPEDDDVLSVYRDYFNVLSGFILKAIDGFYGDRTLSELKRANRELFSDISEKNYASSYANPDFAAERLGSCYGPLLSMFYVELLGIA